MRFFALVSLCVLSVFLSACAKHSTDYLKKGGQISPLVIPADVPPVKQETYYPIPAGSPNTSGKSNSLLPPTLQK